MDVRITENAKSHQIIIDKANELYSKLPDNLKDEFKQLMQWFYVFPESSECIQRGPEATDKFIEDLEKAIEEGRKAAQAIQRKTMPGYYK